MIEMYTYAKLERQGESNRKEKNMKTRSSFQHGYVEKRKRKNGIAYVLRWRVRDPGAKNGWRIKSETLRGCPNKKTAMRELDMRIREVNLVNNGADRPSPATSSSTGTTTAAARWPTPGRPLAREPHTSTSRCSACRGVTASTIACERSLPE